MNDLEVRTPKGTLVASVSTDSLYPGIYIDLRDLTGLGELGLVLVEYDPDSKAIRTHVWSDAQEEDATHHIDHRGAEEYFSSLS